MSEPLLSPDEFAGMFDGTLTEENVEAVTALLSVASNYILGRNAAVDVASARWVLFELARDEVLYGNFMRLSDFQNTTAHRTEAGTLDPRQAAVDDLLTNRQKQLLGIPIAADPQGVFGDGVAVPYIDDGRPAPYYYTPGWVYTFPPGY